MLKKFEQHSGEKISNTITDRAGAADDGRAKTTRGSYTAGNYSSWRTLVRNTATRGSGPSAIGNTRKRSVYIGLDFGTTFTKAAYEIAPATTHIKHSIRFRNDPGKEAYYIPSVVYYDPKHNDLHMENPRHAFMDVKYFKYTMISNALKNSVEVNSGRKQTVTPKEQLYSVFFLSCVISIIRSSIEMNTVSMHLDADTQWYINMGVPLEAGKNNEHADIYQQVLKVAYAYEREFPGKTSANIFDLDMFFQSKKDTHNKYVHVLPELYAEILLYQQSQNIPEGFYTIVDVGGGTVDVATFLKTFEDDEPMVECVSQKVTGHGFDAVAGVIAEGSKAEEISQAKAFLKREDINFNFDKSKPKPKDFPLFVKYQELIDARLNCRSAFGGCVQGVRAVKNKQLVYFVKERRPMTYFVMGGAGGVSFYTQTIDFMIKQQEGAGIPRFSKVDILDYLQENTRLEITNDQRLIISQMLAQPIEMIPDIMNMPWDLKKTDDYIQPSPSAEALRAERQALLDYLYPK